ncbi:MAG: FG-GAP-like repeat-containing protein [Acidimicrobiales bacterium]
MEHRPTPRAREAAHRRLGRHLGRPAAAVLAALAALALPGGPTAPVPAGAATTTMALQGTINHTNSGIYRGSGPKELFSSPAVADVDGDSAPEIVIASMDGTVEAYHAIGRTRLWSRSLGATAIQASPVVVDLDRNGKPDVVVATMDGRVVWLDGATGAVRRTYRQGAPLHCAPGSDCRPDGFFATPAVADITGDGRPEIIAPSYDHTVYAWTAGGTLLWRTFLEDTLWSSPVVADIDRDGRPEIVLGGDIWAGSRLGVPQGGLVWVLRRDGSTYPGYPRSTPGQTVWSSPAVADLNGDKLPDIIVGTGANWPEPAGRRVDAFTAKTRANLRGWPVSVDGRVMASPAVGDIDGDGQLEVSVASDGGWVYAFDASGARKWRACNGTTASQCATGYSTKAGTAIADVDADGQQEVISTLDKDIRVYDGATGRVEDSYRMANPATLAPGATPAVAEVNGVATIVQASLYRANGHGGSAAAGDITKVYVLTTGHGLCRADWPQFHRDAARTGRWRGAHDAWIPFACPASFVRQQYADFLGRTPDQSGTTYWTSRMHAGMTGSTVIRQFMASKEFGNTVGPVVRTYLTVHGTYPPTSKVVTDAVAALRQGASAATVADGFASDTSVKAMDDTTFITAIYQHAYKRSPSYVEVADAKAALGSGATRGQLAATLSESSTGTTRLAPEVNVAMAYLGMLGRAPDAGGWSYWVPKARSGSTDALVTGFQRSSEYRNRVT